MAVMKGAGRLYCSLLEVWKEVDRLNFFFIKQIVTGVLIHRSRVRSRGQFMPFQTSWKSNVE